MGLKVLLYWPNIVGYIRIGLVFAAWAAYETPVVFLPLYSLCVSLDVMPGSRSRVNTLQILGIPPLHARRKIVHLSLLLCTLSLVCLIYVLCRTYF
ncbi:uncharacterized protein si:ch1073-145m9.1 isoform X2 [Oreochromis niloticus]|uniref:uncharacterized protein si:ch1073-145m9.1 isoform X2 n=1 Tax=Oreochromis niloticus TaxID=8128 RepID=UPI000DF26E02|nr:uncharacterized protein LOC102079100 isoform X2 [Oreochromis niloticus]